DPGELDEPDIGSGSLLSGQPWRMRPILPGSAISRHCPEPFLPALRVARPPDAVGQHHAFHGRSVRVVRLTTLSSRVADPCLPAVIRSRAAQAPSPVGALGLTGTENLRIRVTSPLHRVLSPSGACSLAGAPRIGA